MKITGVILIMLGLPVLPVNVVAGVVTLCTGMLIIMLGQLALRIERALGTKPPSMRPRALDPVHPMEPR